MPFQGYDVNIHGPPQQPIDIGFVFRTIISDKPRLTRFDIKWSEDYKDEVEEQTVATTTTTKVAMDDDIIIEQQVTLSSDEEELDNNSYGDIHMIEDEREEIVFSIDSIEKLLTPERNKHLPLARNSTIISPI